MTAALVAATAAAGCAPVLSNPHDHGGGLVDEYVPEDPAMTRPAPASGEYVLFQWQPVPPAGRPAVADGAELLQPSTRPATRPWRPVVQVVHVYVHHGQPVGFRRRPDGLLVAVAGPTTRPLAAGRYCWHMLARDGHPGDARARATLGNVLVVGLVVGAVGCLVVGLIAIDHNDRHAHLGNAVGNVLGGGDSGDDCGCPSN